MYAFREIYKKDAFVSFGFALVLAALTALSYWPALKYDFVYDDFGYVVENYRLCTGLSWDNLAWAFTTFEQANWHPLTWLAFLAQYPFFKLNPIGYHTVNLALHTANVILLFLALRAMTGRPWRSFFAALLFSVHPTHIESVVWISELKDVLSAFFWMTTMLLYAKYVARPGFLKYLAVFFSLALGLLAKPMLVTMPFVLLLLDFWPLGRLRFREDADAAVLSRVKCLFTPSQSNFPRLVVEKAPLLLLVAAASIMTFIAQRAGGAMFPLDKLPFADRIANALTAYAQYLFNLVWPSSLAFHYPHLRTIPLWQSLSCAAALIVITSAILRIRKAAPYALFGWLWFLGALVPVIGIVQVGTQAMADRYLYIPSVGLFIAAVWGFSDTVKKCREGRLVLRALGCAAVFILMMAHISYLKYWKNEIVLYSRGLEITGPNFLAAHNLGAGYLKMHDLDNAFEYFQMARALSPGAYEVYNNLGLVYAHKDNPEEAEKSFKAAIALKENAPSYVNLAVIENRRGAHDKAILLAEKAISLDAYLPEAYVIMGVAHFNLKQYDEAYAWYMKALEVDPSDVNAFYKLGLLYMAWDKPDMALEYFNKILALNELEYNALNTIGVIYLKKHRLKEAESYFQRALAVNKNFKPAIENLESVSRLRKKDK